MSEERYAMVQRCTINLAQKQLLVKRFQEGMTCVNKKNLHLREEAAKETGLSTESVNVGTDFGAGG